MIEIHLGIVSGEMSLWALDTDYAHSGRRTPESMHPFVLTENEWDSILSFLFEWSPIEEELFLEDKDGRTVLASIPYFRNKPLLKGTAPKDLSDCTCVLKKVRSWLLFGSQVYQVFRLPSREKKLRMEGIVLSPDFHACVSLARFAYMYGWADNEVASLIVAFRRKHGEDLKLRRDYYENTLKRAKQGVDNADAIEATRRRGDGATRGDRAPRKCTKIRA